MTDVEIANAALTYLGAGRITALNDQGSPDSRNVSSMFRGAVEEVLRSTQFPEATVRGKLTLYGDDRAAYSPYDYAYAEPKNCLALISMTNEQNKYQPIERIPVPGDPQATPALWVKEGDAFYTDVRDAVGVYTVYPDNLDVLPQYVADAISYELAHRTSTVLGRDPRVTARLFDIARLALKDARDKAGLSGVGAHTASQAWDSRA